MDPLAEKPQIIEPWIDQEDKVQAKQKKMLRRGSKDFENVGGEGEIKAEKKRDELYTVLTASIDKSIRRWDSQHHCFILIDDQEGDRPGNLEGGSLLCRDLVIARQIDHHHGTHGQFEMGPLPRRSSVSPSHLYHR